MIPRHARTCGRFGVYPFGTRGQAFERTRSQTNEVMFAPTSIPPRSTPKDARRPGRRCALPALIWASASLEGQPVPSFSFSFLSVAFHLVKSMKQKWRDRGNSNNRNKERRKGRTGQKTQFKKGASSSLSCDYCAAEAVACGTAGDVESCARFGAGEAPSGVDEAGPASLRFPTSPSLTATLSPSESLVRFPVGT